MHTADESLIDADSLRALLAQPNEAVVLDCRFDLLHPQAGRRAYLAGHIPGARYADLNQDLAAPRSAASGRHPLPRPSDFATTLSRWGIAHDTQVYAYDDTGGSFTARVWWMLRWLGSHSVAVLDGGLKAWTGAGGALQSGEALLPQGAPSKPFVIPADRAAVASVLSAAEVAAGLSNGELLLVDARAAERFAGTVEPIDAVAGHIPGAINHPFSLNLGPDGRFLAPAELRRHWQKLLNGKDPRSVAAMCGSGVTACHNLLSLEVAGLPGAKLYAGSWSEWIKDPDRAVAVGRSGLK